MSKLSHVAAFILGVASGGAAVWALLRKSMEEDLQEKMRSLEAAYANSNKTIAVAPVEEQKKTVTESTDYMRTIYSNGYIDYSKTTVPPTKAKEEATPTPVVTPIRDVPLFATDGISLIEAEELEADDGYRIVEYRQLADGTIIDERNEKVDDYADYIGDALEHFGELGEDDEVAIKNTPLKCVYVVIKDKRLWEHILEDKPLNS